MAPDGQIAIAKVTAAAPASLPRTIAASLTGSPLQWSAFLCFAAAALLWLGPYLWRIDLVSEDAAQHVFWFWQFVNPALLADDPAARYFGSTAVAPWGYRALYALIVPALGPQLAGELVAVGLLALSCLLAWKTGLALGDAAGTKTERDVAGGMGAQLCALLAVVVVLLLVAVRSSDLISAIGFQRSFALPITLLTLWALLARRHAWVGISWLLAALFYPVIVPVLGLAAGVVFVVDIRQRRLPAAFAWNVLAGVAAIAIVLYNSVPEGWVGPAVTLEQARTMPEFGAGGRLALEGGSWRFWITDHRYGIGWPPLALAAFALAVFVARPRRIPVSAWAFAGAGLALWALAHLVHFHLYLPNRHSRTSLAAFGVAAIVIAVFVAMHRLHARASAEDLARRSKTLLRVFASVSPALVAAAFLVPGIKLWQAPVDRDLERMYQAISALPAQTVVAAHPDLADFIPLRTARAVLASGETALPFMPAYYALMKPRVEASLKAAYAESWTALVDALQGYPVDVVLLGPAPRPPGAQLPPFDVLARSLAKHAASAEVLVAGLPEEQVLLRSGEYYLVRIQPPQLDPLQARAPAPHAWGR